MRQAVFTIIAKNYIGLAQVLEKSVKENTDADFYIFVADEFTGAAERLEELPANIWIARERLDIPAGQWDEMAFKYNLIEFCTAIKPFCFASLFAAGSYEKIIYLDPDIYVFSSLEKIFQQLGDHSIIITPHILDMQVTHQGDHPDYLFLVNGTFNLGFIALRNTGNAQLLLRWWQQRMINQCFFDNDRGMATDQKWMNLLPALFDADTLYINKDRGLNVAPWNYHERKIVTENNTLFVTGRTTDDAAPKCLLTFVHFSGYDYKSFSANSVIHKHEGAVHYDDLNIVFEGYAKALQKGDFGHYFHLLYSYNFFSNGKMILNLHRRIYRRLIDENRKYPSPFETGNGSLYELFRKKKLLDHSVAAADKITAKNVPGFERKLGKVNFLFRTLKKILGIRRYSILVRFFRRYFKEENQAFLADKEMGKKLW